MTQSDHSNAIDSYLDSLYGRINYEHQTWVTPEHFKLRNMRELLRRLDNPHLRFPVVHVAGTKGKGSVSTMLGQILSTSGRRTGVYTSPHLDSIHQRMAIDGCPITDSQLVVALTALQPVVTEMDEEAVTQNTRPLTFFEITTAAAFFHFAEQACDVVVLEVGLGGRLDSTNVCSPVACIITNISVDHTRQLGATVDKIAYEKSGIIKTDVPVISGTLDPVAAQVIADTASDKQSPLWILDRDFTYTSDHHSRSFSYSHQPSIPNATPHGPHSNFEIADFEIADLRLQLIGRHQQTNASLAIAATQVLNHQGWKIRNDDIRTGLANATLCGRTEVVRRSPTIVIDMAHNVASILALVDAIKMEIPAWETSSKRKLIFATSHDKDAKAMLEPLIASFDEIILTKYQDNPRGKSELELRELARSIESDLKSQSLTTSEVTTAPSPMAAWNRVASELRNDDFICITGSAFLIAELRPTILKSAVESVSP